MFWQRRLALFAFVVVDVAKGPARIDKLDNGRETLSLPSRSRLTDPAFAGSVSPYRQILPSLDLFRPTVRFAHSPVTLRKPASGSCLPALGDQSPAFVGKRLKHRGLDLA
jgi:hypothetical protein